MICACADARAGGGHPQRHPPDDYNAMNYYNLMI